MKSLGTPVTDEGTKLVSSGRFQDLSISFLGGIERVVPYADGFKKANYLPKTEIVAEDTNFDQYIATKTSKI